MSLIGFKIHGLNTDGGPVVKTWAAMAGGIQELRSQRVGGGGAVKNQMKSICMLFLGVSVYFLSCSRVILGQKSESGVLPTWSDTVAGWKSWPWYFQLLTSKWSLFSHPKYLGWTYALLWPIKCSICVFSADSLSRPWEGRLLQSLGVLLACIDTQAKTLNNERMMRNYTES